MNKDEILQEFNKVNEDFMDYLDRVMERHYNRSRIKARRTKKNVELGTFSKIIGGTRYYSFVTLKFDEGTKEGAYPTILKNPYTIINTDSGRKVAIQIFLKSKNIEDSKSNVVEYSSHSIKRYYERTRKESPENIPFETLAEIYFKEAGSGMILHFLDNIQYKNYPGGIVIGKVIGGGIILGFEEETTGKIKINTYVSEDMFYEDQEEIFGENSLSAEELRKIHEIIM